MCRHLGKIDDIDLYKLEWTDTPIKQAESYPPHHQYSRRKEHVPHIA